MVDRLDADQVRTDALIARGFDFERETWRVSG